MVGVMPPRAALPGPIGEDGDLWISTHMDARQRSNDISHNYTILARLADGTTLEQATAELEAAAARAAAERPSSHKNLGVRLVPVAEQTVRAIRPTLFVAAGGVALLLLVASANAATLLIARAANRQHELAVRAALGATARAFPVAGDDGKPRARVPWQSRGVDARRVGASSADPVARHRFAAIAGGRHRRAGGARQHRTGVRAGARLRRDRRVPSSRRQACWDRSRLRPARSTPAAPGERATRWSSPRSRWRWSCSQRRD